MIDRPARGGERSVLVHIEFPRAVDRGDLAEFQALAKSAGVSTVTIITGARASPDPKYFVGTGKAEEIHRAVTDLSADVVLFNHTLSPSQERNLETLFQCRVLDRTGLILDIFAQRARSFEGKLQVELAQLQHLATRLVRGWTHLERQKGGIGLRGPGETQLESDRRLVSGRIKQLNRRLKKVRAHRNLTKRARQRSELPSVSLVGYTNAGKSTLFNALTGAQAFVADQLFATLDPTLRKLEPNRGDTLLVSDTVGFIRDLPHDLVEAFRSTLEETLDADLLLHVINADDPAREETVAQVEAVLEEIGVGSVKVLKIYNKIDRIGVLPHVDRDALGVVSAVWVSAQTGEGVDVLHAILRELFYGQLCDVWVELPMTDGRTRAYLYQHNYVRAEQFTEQNTVYLRLELAQSQLEHLLADATFGLRVLTAAEGKLASCA